MSCILHVYGKNFDIDDFLSGRNLSPYDVYRRGEPQRYKRRDGSTTNANSGIKIEVSNREMDDLQGQFKDAISFLIANRADLSGICCRKDIEGARLDFGSTLRIGKMINGKEIATQSDYLPPELLKEAGNLGIGIEISIYP